VIELIEVRCPTCFSDFQASAADCGRDVMCPTCGQAVSAGGATSTAEGEPFTREQMNVLLDLATAGINRLIAAQEGALAE
jgi:ribonuclease PH